MTDGGKAVVQFSGGKDSTALLYLLRDRLPSMTVLFANTGAAFPHVRAFVEETCAKLGAPLRIVRPPESVETYIARTGLPADIVPVEADAAFAPLLTGGVKEPLQPWIRCCWTNLWLPMQAAIKEMGATTVYRGSKACDARVGVPTGHVEDGVTFLSPLWKWSDSDVMAFLDREGATLPAHYESVPDSLDCWLCTGHMAHHGAAKLAWTREHYPGLWPDLSSRVRRVEAVMEEHVGRISAALDEAKR